MCGPEEGENMRRFRNEFWWLSFWRTVHCNMCWG